MKLRLFVGITAPPEWKRAITEWRCKIQPQFSDSFARWTSEENLHLTLRFFGSVEEADSIAIGEALQQVVAETGSFSLSPRGLGCFPNAARPRIVWLGFEEDTAPLVALEAKLRAATAAFGRAPEDRDFHPHITLARVKEARSDDRGALSELMKKGLPIDVPDWRVQEIELIRSTLSPSGSIYTPLAAYRLRQ
jgi:RNA 2',3'-cyclic 3'-phosphodiesterase